MDYPDMYQFPPFFTLQPVEETRAKQIQMWIELLNSFQEFHGLDHISVTSEVWRNSHISRGMDQEQARMVLDEIVRKEMGVWEDSGKQKCLTTSKSFKEWASLLYSWAQNNFNLGQIFTLYELSSGDATRSEVFHQVPCKILLRAVQILEKEGKASVIYSDQVDEVGVKFIG